MPSRRHSASASAVAAVAYPRRRSEGPDRVADVAAELAQEVVELVPHREEPDQPTVDGDPARRAGDQPVRDALAPLVVEQHVDPDPEGVRGPQLVDGLRPHGAAVDPVPAELLGHRQPLGVTGGVGTDQLEHPAQPRRAPMWPSVRALTG